MTKEFGKTFSYAVIGLFIILGLYLVFFLYSSGFFSNLLTGKAIDEISIEDYEEELNQVTDETVYDLFFSYWWVLIIIVILIIILIVLIIIVRKSKSKGLIKKEERIFKNTGDPITDKALDLIKKSKDAGLSNNDIKKIFIEAEWKEIEVVKILKRYYEELEKIEEEKSIEKPVK